MKITQLSSLALFLGVCGISAAVPAIVLLVQNGFPVEQSMSFVKNDVVMAPAEPVSVLEPEASFSEKPEIKKVLFRAPKIVKKALDVPEPTCYVRDTMDGSGQVRICQ